MVRRRNRGASLPVVLIVLGFAGGAETGPVHVDTEKGGDVFTGTRAEWTASPQNSNGALFWNGSRWVSNDTAAHMYFTDLRTGQRLLEYVVTAVDSTTTALGLLPGIPGGFTVTKSLYSYLARTSSGNGAYAYSAVQYEVVRADGIRALLRSRGTGAGTGQAHFDAYVGDPAGNTTGILGDPVWFEFAGMTPAQAAGQTPDVGGSAVRGNLPTCGDPVRARYWMDMNGGSDMGGFTYQLKTSCFDPSRVRTAALGSSFVTSFSAMYMDGGGQLQELRFTPALASETFQPDAGASTPLLVPVVLSMDGLQGSFFTTELSLTNRSSTDAALKLTYTASSGGGSGTASTSLSAHEQTMVPDAISWLRSLRIPIPVTGRFLGTLRIDVSGPQPGEVAVTARTTTPVPEGRAGLAYPAVPDTGLFDTAVTLPGLRSNASDRSNVAIVNGSASKDARLKVVVTSWSLAAVASASFEADPLGPGGFRQYTLEDVVSRAGLTLANPNVFVRVEPLSGSAPFYAYAVVNDQGSSDGSFVFPVSDGSLSLNEALVLPVVVETGSAAPFTTEVVFTNTSPEERVLDLAWVTTFGSTPGGTVHDSLTLAPFQQRIVSSFVDDLRKRGIAGVGGVGSTYAGALFVRPTGIGRLNGVVVSGRTSAAGSVKGRYGLFQSALRRRDTATTPAWIYGLLQDETNRSNLAFVNADPAGSAIRLRVELFRATDGAAVGTIEGVETTLAPGAWGQIDRVLERYAPGTTSAYARITLVSGTSPFLAYAVVNDGGQPGQRSGDGAYVPMTLE